MTVRIALALLAAVPAPVPAAAQQAPAPPAPTLEFVFAETVTLAPAVTPGPTAHGGRVIIPITGGTFAGPSIRGVVMPGGWDWQLHRPDGCTDISADYFLKTDDGVVINIVNQGTVCQPAPGQPFSGRTQPRFEVPTGKYDWLAKNSFVGTLDPAKGPRGEPAVRIGIYRVR